MIADPTTPRTLSIVVPADVYEFIALRPGSQAQHAEDAADILTSVVRLAMDKLRECDRLFADAAASSAREGLAA